MSEFYRPFIVPEHPEYQAADPSEVTGDLMTRIAGAMGEVRAGRSGGSGSLSRIAPRRVQLQ